MPNSISAQSSTKKILRMKSHILPSFFCPSLDISSLVPLAAEIWKSLHSFPLPKYLLGRISLHSKNLHSTRLC
ncbi:hypothetical protein M430DRAFT_218247 [Amorphotheca resinae ATCC 22711]|uniref:Uncharacterized protein n=1 Tax=Amorphotheca resinae ATCC 22711 TaxID=857342 RepID=A0A2T3B533_AMORE|nr:hypothetical protein M430DRAFT_218247 [Amorphotheca resinae ATCC 22711]PSS21880.1 hypothetical protein M430DRAFT_218247 [Amorphotheca resinae ATCC 22711]